MSVQPGAAADAGAPVHVECRRIRKVFGGTVALDAVSLAIRSGSVHALVGENGAGKSTLGKLLAGVLQPDGGEIVVNGAPVAFRSPREALDHGIALVAQELALVPRLSVAHNVFLGAEPRRAGFVNERALAARYDELAASSGFDLPAAVPAGRLPIAHQQQVEILRALARNAALLVLDEPTAALSGEEARKLHEIVRGLAAAGRTVVLVSHFLREVLELADTVTILRDGHVVRTSRAADETEATLIAGMLGRSLGRSYPERHAPPRDAPVVLAVQDLVGPGVRGVSLDIRAGEIVGLAGLVGAGRSELVRSIFGAADRIGGRIEISGGALAGGPRDALSAGVALIPESRASEGLLMGRPVRENVSLPGLRRLSRLGLVDRPAEHREVSDALGRSAVRAQPSQPAVTLSGGNQQKVLFARALLLRPRLLLADEPTRGVDVGAKLAIYELITTLAAGGVAVLLVSSEIEEILGLSHRVLVMRGGSLVADLAGDQMTEENVLDAAFGRLMPVA